MVFTKSVAMGLALLSTTGLAQYTLQQDYFSTGDFFGQFTFFTGTDPTQGFVVYEDQSDAQSMGLINETSSNARMMVSNQGTTPNGRPSVRISSNNAYNTGLVIIDVDHMPGGICGTWPAFWMLGPDWPNTGEIDIIEGVNDQSVNDMTLHTSDGCTINDGGFTGQLVTSNCYVNAAGQGDNQGCGITTTDTSTYGSQFNSNGGGVYATQITGSLIAIWFFPRSSIPSDITNGSPDPSGWGTPLAQYTGGCSIPDHFQNLNIVFDTTLCGSWAGNVWGNSQACTALDSSCNDYVANNPSAFTDAYWSVNALKVYQDSSSQGSNKPHSIKHVPYTGPTPNLKTPWYGAGAPKETKAPKSTATKKPATKKTTTTAKAVQKTKAPAL